MNERIIADALIEERLSTLKSPCRELVLTPESRAIREQFLTLALLETPPAGKISPKARREKPRRRSPVPDRVPFFPEYQPAPILPGPTARQKKQQVKQELTV